VPGRDTRWQAVDRPTLKRKHPRFDDARYDESSAWSPRAALSESEWRQLVTLLVNPARVASARSKVGDDPALVADEVVLDVLVDLDAFQPRAFKLADLEGVSALIREALRVASPG
jgi:hypothetical protein